MTAIFPTSANTPGLGWSVTQTPKFSTGIQRSVSGKELRTSFMAYPLWTVQLTYDVLRQDTAHNELHDLMGFFLARQGAFDAFFWTNPNDSIALNENIGTGNGSNTAFQLARQIGYGGNLFNEPVNSVNVVSGIAFNGVTQNVSNYSVAANGLVTFTANGKPGNGVTVTWNGSYYYKVRFTDDSADFDNFMYALWQLKKLAFVGSVVNKV